MEQKKTLWIIAAVGVFLLGVLLAPIILHNPARNPVSEYSSVSPVEKKPSTSGWTQPAADISAPTSLPDTIPVKEATDLVVLADNTTVYSPNTTVEANGSTTIDLNALKNEAFTETPATVQTQPQNINITVTVPETKKVENTTVTTTIAKTETPSENTKVVQKAESKAVKTTPAPKTAAKAVTKTAEPAPKAEPKKTQYWVQVAAYSNKKGAEGARSILDENKIPSDIFTYRDNKDKLYYRVRVGPYTTKSEAEYWRTKIIKISDIDNANDSYITSTTI